MQENKLGGLSKVMGVVWDRLCDDRNCCTTEEELDQVLKVVKQEIIRCELVTVKVAKPTVGMVYLAGPVDASPNPRDWREEVALKLGEHGISSFSPAHAARWAKNIRGGLVISAINELAIRLSDALIVYYPKDQCTVGTTVDLLSGVAYDKHIAVVTDIEKPMLFLQAFPRFSDFDSAIEHTLSLR